MIWMWDGGARKPLLAEERCWSSAGLQALLPGAKQHRAELLCASKAVQSEGMQSEGVFLLEMSAAMNNAC